MQPLIVGAGLSGLIAACRFTGATIIEAGEPIEQHKALLRFRDHSVADITGIPFKKVKVRKEVYMDGEARNHCSIKAANLYAKKVTGSISGRSIQNLDPVERYVAPEDFYWRLQQRLADRIEYRTPFNAEYLAGLGGRPVVSTAPMSANMAAAGISTFGAAAALQRQAIKVNRIKLKDADVYQTIYFPDPEASVYRASITGNLLIIESMGSKDIDGEWTAEVLNAFGLSESDLDMDTIESVDQRHGKIVDLETDLRHSIMYSLTTNHNIFSLGRFACWRNILLDDVAKDIEVIGKLLQASDYARQRAFMGGK